MTLVRKSLLFSALSLFVGVFSLATSNLASAHVVVRPAEVITAGFQSFTVGVPNEKDIPTTEVKLIVPAGLQHVTPTQKAGWNISVQKDGQGDSTTVKSITWSGGKIAVGLRDEFTFSAKSPDSATELKWLAYQTYSDGSVVSWDEEPRDESGHNSSDTGPYSSTSVVVDTTTDTAIKKIDQATASTKVTADRAFYVAIGGIVVGLIGVFLATRKAKD